MNPFARRLKDARIAMGLTQEQLGFAVGVTKSSVSAWENGRESPSFNALLRLRDALQCSIDGLLDEESGSRSGPGPLAIRDAKEQALLRRFRSLNARRRLALLELIGAENDTPKPAN